MASAPVVKKIFNGDVRKGIADLHRRTEASQKANALASVVTAGVWKS